jgi:hypothetical protein
MTTSNDFPATRAALTEYDKKTPALEKAWGEAWTTEQIRACQKLSAEALTPVQTAFYLDTCDINSKENCMSLDICSIAAVIKNASKD